MANLVILQEKLLDLLEKFETAPDADLRGQVLSLVPVWDALIKLGTSLIPCTMATAARSRILTYFQKYPYTIISHKELMVVSGISEWARRVRELRQDQGWNIQSGAAVKQMQEAGDLPIGPHIPDCSQMQVDDYILLSTVQDREAAHRWKTANEIRRQDGNVQQRILAFLLANVGRPVSGDELQYVARNASEWARRVRELRTEKGWQINTHWNGRRDLAPGMYVLESERQLPVHDRDIPDAVRYAVLDRDKFICQKCGWNPDTASRADHRHLEVHHADWHINKGSNEINNLTSLCNVCHDIEHAKNK